LLSDLDANRADSIVITVAGSLFLLAGLLSLRLKKSQLGPMTEEINFSRLFILEPAPGGQVFHAS
ncbi:MAG: hypothetical protein ACO23R_19125, partial [bacterium]